MVRLKEGQPIMQAQVSHTGLTIMPRMFLPNTADFSCKMLKQKTSPLARQVQPKRQQLLPRPQTAFTRGTGTEHMQPWRKGGLGCYYCNCSEDIKHICKQLLKGSTNGCWPALLLPLREVGG